MILWVLINVSLKPTWFGAFLLELPQWEQHDFVGFFIRTISWHQPVFLCIIIRTVSWGQHIPANLLEQERVTVRPKWYNLSEKTVFHLFNAFQNWRIRCWIMYRTRQNDQSFLEKPFLALLERAEGCHHNERGTIKKQRLANLIREISSFGWVTLAE